MSKVSSFPSSASQSQSSEDFSDVGCGESAGRRVVKQLDLYSAPAPVRREERAAGLRAMVKAIIYKDIKEEAPQRWFAGQLGIDESSASRKLNGRGDFNVNADDIALVMELPSALDLGNWYGAQLGQKPYEPRRVLTDREIITALRRIVIAMGPMGTKLIEEIAASLGVTPETVLR